LAKNLYLSPSRNPLRKLRELILRVDYVSSTLLMVLSGAQNVLRNGRRTRRLSRHRQAQTDGQCQRQACGAVMVRIACDLPVAMDIV
jgi:hypothetical protein